MTDRNGGGGDCRHLREKQTFCGTIDGFKTYICECGAVRFDLVVEGTKRTVSRGRWLEGNDVTKKRRR